MECTEVDFQIFPTNLNNWWLVDFTLKGKAYTTHGLKANNVYNTQLLVEKEGIGVSGVFLQGSI